MSATWFPPSPGLSDAELDAIMLSCAGRVRAPAGPLWLWLQSVRAEWHRRGLYKRFDDER